MYKNKGKSHRTTKPNTQTMTPKPSVLLVCEKNASKIPSQLHTCMQICTLPNVITPSRSLLYPLQVQSPYLTKCSTNTKAIGLQKIHICKLNPNSKVKTIVKKLDYYLIDQRIRSSIQKLENKKQIWSFSISLARISLKAPFFGSLTLKTIPTQKPSSLNYRNRIDPRIKKEEKNKTQI